MEITDYVKILRGNFNCFQNESIIDVCNNIIKILNTQQLKKKYEGILIDTYKYLSETEYLNKDYQKCLNYTESMLMMDIYKRENTQSRIHIKIRELQCKIYLAIYSMNKYDLSKLLDETIKFKNSYNVNIKDALLEDIDRIIDLAESYIYDQVFTSAKFQLPYMINISKDSPVKFSYQNIEVELNFEHKFNNNGMLGFIQSTNGQVALEKDKYGILNYSNIEIKFNRFWDITHDFSNFQEWCTEIFNYFLQYYKNMSEEYWLDNICVSKIYAVSAVVFTNHNEIINVPIYSGQDFVIYNKNELNKKVNVNNLIEVLNESMSIDSYKILMMDARNSLLIEDFRETILQVNSAFESFLATKSREIVYKYMGIDKANDFLEGYQDYEDFELKEYLTKEEFLDAKERGLITKYVPSTYKIIKKCYELTAINIPRRKANDLVDKIRKNRNDLIHGRIISTEDIKKDAYNSITAFEEFSTKFIEKNSSK